MIYLLTFSAFSSMLNSNVKTVHDSDPEIASDLCARDLRDLSESVIHDFNYCVTDRNPNDRLMRCSPREKAHSWC